MIPSSAKPSERVAEDQSPDRDGHGPHADQTMSGVHIDILGTARDLEASGLGRPQAEAIARAIGCTEEPLATKADFERHEASTKTNSERFQAEMRTEFERFQAEMRTEFEQFAAVMQANFERFQAEVKADIASLRAEMYRALWIQGAGVVAIVAALKYLP